MAAAPRGLGKGLGALIPTEATASSPTASNPTAARSPAPQAQTPVTYLELPIDSIAPNPVQPRTVFSQEALDELVFSIKTIGLLQPIVVRKTKTGSYELIAGMCVTPASLLARNRRSPAISS